MYKETGNTGPKLNGEEEYLKMPDVVLAKHRQESSFRTLGDGEFFLRALASPGTKNTSKKTLCFF